MIPRDGFDNWSESLAAAEDVDITYVGGQAYDTDDLPSGDEL